MERVVSVYQVCTKCVMDTTDSKITFDEKGVCDHCLTFDRKIQPYWRTDQTAWLQISQTAEQIKRAGKGKDFDCIMGMSGGVDSSYLLYLAVEKLGLRPLVFHVDAGWNSQEAVNNIECIVDSLGLDLYTEVINWEEMKDLQLSFFKASVPHIDTPQDHAFFATMYRFAAKHNIKYILTGANYSTECIRNPLEWMYYQSDAWQIKAIHKQFGQHPLKDYPLTSILWHKVFLPYFRKIKVIRPLNFLPYNKEEAIQFLVSRFGFQPYPQKHFESRFTRFYEGYWLPKKFGYDTRKVQFSSLILTGQMSRDEAIKKLKSSALSEADSNLEFEYVASKLGISSDQLRSYFDLPNRTHLNYRSQAKLYDWGAKAMRLLGVERGGKR